MKKPLLCILAILLIVVLVSCFPGKSNTESSPEYKKLTHFFHELDNFSYIVAEGEELLEDGTLFIFEKSIAEDVRRSFVQSQLELNKLFDIPDGSIFVLTESYQDRFDEACNVCFVLTTSVQTWKQVLTTIQLSEGDDVTYGYAYAKADDISKKLGWETDQRTDVPDSKVETMLSEDPERLSLVYPCFISPYSSPEQIDAAKVLALQIYEIPENTPNEDAFSKKISAYAEEHSIPYHETYLKFADGGKSVPLIIRTLFVEEWITDDFETDLYNITVYLRDNVNWQKNISEMVRIREVSDSSIEHARKVLKFDGIEREIAIYFQYQSGKTGTGLFDYNTHRLYVSSPIIICHEYVHYINWELSLNMEASEKYCCESLACYFSVWSEYEAYKYLVAAGEIENDIYSLNECIEDIKLSNAKRLASKDISPTKELKTNDGWYGKYYSFGLYLSDIYGEETFGQLMLFPERAADLVGKTIDELVADWDNYVSAFANQ